MSDEEQVVGQGQGQAPEAAPTEQAQGTTTEQSEFVTRAEAQRVADAAAEAALRKAQSMFDRGRDGILKKVQSDLATIAETIERQRAIGVEVTPEQEEAMKSRVLARALDEPVATDAASPAKTAPQPEAAQETLDPVSAEALGMMQAAGVTIEDDDPEFGQIVQTSPYAFLKSVEAAIAAKQERLALPPAGRVAGVPGAAGVASSNPIANITDPGQLLRLGLK